MTDAMQPPEPEPPPEPGSPSVARGAALGVVGFAATLILLFGLASFLQPSHGGGTAAASAMGAPSATSNGQSQGLASGSPAGSMSSSSPPGPAPSRTSVPNPAPTGVSASGDPILVGAGDIADCGLPDDGATAALIDAIPGTVFNAGDNAYPDGTADQFRDCYGPTWGRFLDRTRPAPGNHDWATKGLAGYLGFFGTAAAPNGTSWYSYDLGTWHVVVLDSNCSAVGGCEPGSAQGRWLADDLKSSTTRCTLAIWHHPRFSSGEHGPDAEVGPFWRALYDAGADVIVNGHDHDYERFAPQDPTGRLDRGRGLREFVVGTGGAALRTFPTTAVNSEIRATISHGVIRLVLHPASYEWRFISTSGEFSDSGSGSCH